MTSTPLVFNSIVKSKIPFFKIYETPVLYKYPLVNDELYSYPEKKIIINQNTNNAISIVGDYFKPILHEQAFGLGIKIFELLFDTTPSIHQESINANTTDYSVDFVSEKCKIIFDSTGYYFSNDNGSSLFGSRSNQLMETIAPPITTHSYISSKFYDEYHPFIRVSNYLRSGESFKIEMGYYRYRCSNGLMMGRRTKFTFKHSYRKSFYVVDELATQQFLDSKIRFMEMSEKLWRLLNIPIPKKQMHLVSYDIFQNELIKKSAVERQKLQKELSNLVDKYTDEIGENLNAAINVATDFSKQFESGKVSKSSIQDLATKWINKAVKKSFKIQAYLNSSAIKGIENRILNAKVTNQEEEEEIEL
jgi:Domain of unknown function (DUF932)